MKFADTQPALKFFDRCLNDCYEGTPGADLGSILTDFLKEWPREQASRGAPGNFFLIFKVPKVPFLGFLSNARKLEKENICPDYFPESSIIVILLLKMFIVKNLTDFRKTVETGVDPRLNTEEQNNTHRSYFWRNLFENPNVSILK